MRVRPEGPQLISEMVQRTLGVDCSVLMGANIAEVGSALPALLYAIKADAQPTKEVVAQMLALVDCKAQLQTAQAPLDSHEHSSAGGGEISPQRLSELGSQIYFCMY